MILSFIGFNPRTHVGCDICIIHRLVSTERFQSTHPRGVRLQMKMDMLSLRCFNPRTHVGCDPFIIDGLTILFVSIHAPTWGATFKELLGGSSSQFQSTHPRGVRRALENGHEVTEMFQSTHPRGVRRSIHFITLINVGFNPRTHVGCDNGLICVIFVL